MADRRRRKLPRIRAQIRRVIRTQILGLSDTPHRIAFGVFLGFVVGATPTMGFQIVLYVTIAFIVRANKVAGIPPVMISNPVTAFPLYYSTWWVGNLLLTGGGDADGGGRAAIERMISATESMGGFWESVLQLAYWKELGRLLWDLGLELWVGGIVCGAVAGVVAYPFAYRGVVKYRERRAARQARLVKSKRASETVDP